MEEGGFLLFTESHLENPQRHWAKAEAMKVLPRSSWSSQAPVPQIRRVKYEWSEIMRQGITRRSKEESVPLC